MENRLFTITSFKNDHGPSVMNHQSSLKAELHQNKIMLFVWWDWKGMVVFELLPRNETINFDVYCRQLNKVNTAVKE